MYNIKIKLIMEYNLKKIVDQIYIINLDKDIDRMKILDKKMKN